MKPIIQKIQAVMLLQFLLLLSGPANAQIPIEIIGKLPIVKATVNGVEGNYILDTGAPHLFLNSKYFKGEPTDRELHGINGETIPVESLHVRFELGIVGKKCMYSEIVPMNLIETALGIPLMGLIGVQIFRNCELIIDYAQREIDIIALGRHKERPGNASQEPSLIIRYKQKNYLPCFEASLNGNKVILGLDSGAGVNVLEIDRFKNLGGSASGNKEPLTSIGFTVKLVSCIELSGLQITGQFCRPMKTALLSLDKLNRDLGGARIDGIVGYELLMQYRVAINFKKKEFTLWEFHPEKHPILAGKSVPSEINDTRYGNW